MRFRNPRQQAQFYLYFVSCSIADELFLLPSALLLSQRYHCLWCIHRLISTLQACSCPAGDAQLNFTSPALQPSKYSLASRNFISTLQPSFLLLPPATTTHPKPKTYCHHGNPKIHRFDYLLEARRSTTSLSRRLLLRSTVAANADAVHGRAGY